MGVIKSLAKLTSRTGEIFRTRMDKWLRTSMSYHKFANLSKTFEGDLNTVLCWWGVSDPRILIDLNISVTPQKWMGNKYLIQSVEDL